MSAGHPVNREMNMEASTSDQRRSNIKPVRESHLDLLREGTFSDAIFIVGPNKERIPCHQLFLKARSSVFAVMFSERWNQDSIKEIQLGDADPKIFKIFLEYIYADILVANVSEALGLLQLAHMYDVQSLVGRCEKLMEIEVTPDDAVDVFQVARKYDMIQLMDKVGDLMAKSLYTLQSHPSFSRVDKETLMYILRRNDLKMKEVDLFRLVLKWAQGQPVSTIVFDLLPLIRFPLMTLDEFTAAVVPTGLLPQSTLVELFTYFGSDAETKKSLARTIRFSTQHRKHADSIVSVALYSGDIFNMNTRREQFKKLMECLQFVFRTEYSHCSTVHARPALSGFQQIIKPIPIVGQVGAGIMKTFGLNGITIYCPARTTNTFSRTFADTFKKFKILVRGQDSCDSGNDFDAGASHSFKQLLSMPAVGAKEGNVTEIKFDKIVPIHNKAQYCISVEEIKPCLPAYPHLAQSYDAKCFGNYRSPLIVKIDEKPVFIQMIQRNHLQEFQHNGYPEPQLICKLSLTEV